MELVSWGLWGRWEGRVRYLGVEVAGSRVACAVLLFLFLTIPERSDWMIPHSSYSDCFCQP